MKCIWLIVLLLSTTGLHAHHPMERLVSFPVISQETEHLFCDKGEANQSLFTVRNGLSPDQIVIDLTSEKMKYSAKYEIFNIFGSRLIAGQITEKTTTVSITGLPKGFYIIRIIIDKEQSAKKFMVK